MLEAATAAACDKLYELLIDRCGSHVVRALLAALAGRAVEPARTGRGGPGGGGGTPSATAEEDGGAAAFPRGRAGKAKAPATALASRGVPAGVGSSSTSISLPPPPARHAGLIRKVARVVLSKDWANDLGRLSYDGYAAPALQALLRASKGADDLVCELVPRLLGAPPAAESNGDGEDEEEEEEEEEKTVLPAVGSRLALLTKDAIHAAARERPGSHLIEAVLEVSPRSLRTEFDARFLRGSFAALAEDPRANFVVQAALGAADTPAAVNGASKELGPVARRLLARSRGGVLLSLVGAAGRVGRAGGVGGGSEKEKEGDASSSASAAVAAAAEAVAAALETATDRASALLVLGEKPLASASAADVEATKKFSAVGCALLASLLSLPLRQAASPYATALAALPDSCFARVAADGAGSRAVEALFTGPGLGAKSKKAAGKKLAGRLGVVASTPGGVHTIERAYESAGAGGREAIAAELALAAKEGTLSTGPLRVVALMRKCGVVEWQQRLREGGGGGGGGGEGGAWKQPRAPSSAPWRAPTSAAALLGEEVEDDKEDEEEATAAVSPASAPAAAASEPKLPRKRGGAKRAARAARASAAIAKAREEQAKGTEKKKRKQKETE